VDPAIAWRAISLLMLGWLAFFFGRTLRRGQVPLITRIALVGDPALPAALLRYTRGLTAVWCVYFILAALVALACAGSGGWVGAFVWTGSAALFVGEHRVRPLFFPDQDFPGLRQQLKDTWSVWRPGRQHGA
jgi:uncharacterized membrane protein